MHAYHVDVKPEQRMPVLSVQIENHTLKVQAKLGPMTDRRK